jgi:hypothetical protein
MTYPNSNNNLRKFPVVEKLNITGPFFSEKEELIRFINLIKIKKILNLGENVEKLEYDKISKIKIFARHPQHDDKDKKLD